MAASDDPAVWLAQLKRWDIDGTNDRVAAAIKRKGTVQVRRSSGVVGEGTILGFGFGGRAVRVAVDDGGEIGFKCVPMDDLLELNPHLRGAAPKAGGA